ncbi:DNA-binding response regulator, LuxR family [Burkholderia pseudomallei 1710b]|uniref:DNA-binding response regulator, LuxR family n=1 Tax=Burkholderia pseudomallei (strain 1710b) TaxID=320372 RepID=Q3JSJ1_BURP1|nr:DNA-binding response regulator, LuxR family [Burkholderia pseudomallei 1710b]
MIEAVVAAQAEARLDDRLREIRIEPVRVRGVGDGRHDRHEPVEHRDRFVERRARATHARGRGRRARRVRREQLRHRLPRSRGILSEQPPSQRDLRGHQQHPRDRIVVKHRELLRRAQRERPTLAAQRVEHRVRVGHRLEQQIAALALEQYRRRADRARHRPVDAEKQHVLAQRGGRGWHDSFGERQMAIDVDADEPRADRIGDARREVALVAVGRRGGEQMDGGERRLRAERLAQEDRAGGRIDAARQRGAHVRMAAREARIDLVERRRARRADIVAGAGARQPRALDRAPPVGVDDERAAGRHRANRGERRFAERTELRAREFDQVVEVPVDRRAAKQVRRLRIDVDAAVLVRPVIEPHRMQRIGQEQPAAGGGFVEHGDVGAPDGARDGVARVGQRACARERAIDARRRLAQIGAAAAARFEQRHADRPIGAGRAGQQAAMRGRVRPRAPFKPPARTGRRMRRIEAFDRFRHSSFSGPVRRRTRARRLRPMHGRRTASASRRSRVGRARSAAADAWRARATFART